MDMCGQDRGYGKELGELNGIDLLVRTLQCYPEDLRICELVAILVYSICLGNQDDEARLAIYNTGVFQILLASTLLNSYAASMCTPVLSAIVSVTESDVVAASFLASDTHFLKSYIHAQMALVNNPDDPLLASAVAALFSQLYDADRTAQGLYSESVIEQMGQTLELILPVPQAQGAVAQILSYLGYVAEHAIETVSSKGVHLTAVRAMQTHTHSASICVQALQLLMQMQHYREDTSDAVFQAGLVPILSTILQTHATEEVVSACLDMVGVMAYSADGSHPALVDSGCLRLSLAAIDRFPDNVDLAIGVFRLVFILLGDGCCAPALLALGAVRTGLEVMDRHPGNDEALMHILSVIRKMCISLDDGVARPYMFENGCHLVAIRAIRAHHDPRTDLAKEVVHQAAMVLWTLTHEEPTFRPDLFNIDNAQLLMSVAATCKDEVHLLEPVFGTLGNLANCSELAGPMFQSGVHTLAHEAVKRYPESSVLAEVLCELVMVFAGEDTTRPLLISDGCTLWVKHALDHTPVESEGDLPLYGLNALERLAREATHVPTMLEMGVLETVDTVTRAWTQAQPDVDETKEAKAEREMRNQLIHEAAIRVREVLERK
ncbi:hypothetical protein KIPB_003765 [Kipferlia bialata]|uniref:Uncharacterized protein n=1 Tax=Kipferlia bialata TaxID=797122 RepID=A0A9K3GHP4_9EUKA|nr:hypothetical protein KIPB_003765 [Kipferlia bialata]|eukprot:g3765.t1